jgi:hypothetical protein
MKAEKSASHIIDNLGQQLATAKERTDKYENSVQSFKQYLMVH